MKRWLAVVAGGFGLAAYLRRRRRRRALPAEPEPADELRARLAEARREQESASVPEGAPPAPDQDPDEAAGDDLERRRRDVHERARQTLDDLR